MTCGAEGSRHRRRNIAQLFGGTEIREVVPDHRIIVQYCADSGAGTAFPEWWWVLIARTTLAIVPPETGELKRPTRPTRE
jgi:hypothetical protein